MDFNTLMSALAIFVISFGIGLIIGQLGQSADYKKSAIERGYAQYCEKTGNWAWKGECE